MIGTVRFIDSVTCSKYYGSLPWTSSNHIMQQNPGNMESLSLVPGEWISGMQPNIKSKGQKLES